MTLHPARAVTSNQTGCHEQLEKVVRRHLNSRFRRPIAAHSAAAFAEAERWLSERDAPLLLDSYCGTGESTLNLARAHPDCAVIGVDKSAHRLDKHPGLFSDTPDNYLLLRADTNDFWRLALEAGWKPRRHTLFYPNPWPKSAQLQRRCHGSPLFPTLLALGGELELRSNWPIYVEEFARALQIAGHSAAAEPFQPQTPITAFERKYQAAGQALWRCRVQL